MKKILYAILLFPTLAFAASGAGIFDHTLTSPTWVFNLEECGGTTSEDSSGRHNSGTIAGAAWVQDLKLGCGLSFNGLGTDTFVTNENPDLSQNLKHGYYALVQKDGVTGGVQMAVGVGTGTGTNASYVGWGNNRIQVQHYNNTQILPIAAPTGTPVGLFYTYDGAVQTICVFFSSNPIPLNTDRPDWNVGASTCHAETYGGMTLGRPRFFLGHGGWGDLYLQGKIYAALGWVGYNPSVKEGVQIHNQAIGRKVFGD